MKQMYDVTVIGCGVVGAGVACELSRYRLSVAVLERENDVACGTTKANSAIVHAGYDPMPGTMMARLNVQGSRMMEDLCRRLSVEYRRIGSLVLAFCDEDLGSLRELYRRGKANGVEGLELLTGEQTLKMEPNLSPEVRGALYAPTAAIVNPWGLAIALAQTAVQNGAELHRNAGVRSIAEMGGYYRIGTDAGTFETRYIVNAAGTHAGEVNDLAAKPFFKIIPVKGEYYVLDKNQGGAVSRTIFQCPDKNGKGVLISPTVDGNLIVGPTADPAKGPDDTSVTAEGLAKIVRVSARSSERINFRESIRNFSGVRATVETDDFIIGASPDAPRFVNAAAIKSPGLSASPAIALEVRSILEELGLVCARKENTVDTREHKLFRDMTDEERKEALKHDPLYGRVICRCETITEGDILNALHSPIPPVSIDGVKRRCNAGMGRCQGGFCGPRVHEILNRETGVGMERICQDRAGSTLLVGETKRGGAGT
jgi:glycerol-3-phosphate dehydrogenase